MAGSPCNFECIAQELAAELANNPADEHDEITRRWCKKILADHGPRCFARVQTLIQIHRSGIDLGKSMPTESYGPAQWEKILAWAIGVVIVGVCCFVVLRNEPFADLNLVVVIRILLALFAGLFGVVVPGLLRVEGKWKGWQIRATAGFALAVLVYSTSPEVIIKLNVDEEEQPAKIE